jgi:hypothetical protein
MPAESEFVGRAEQIAEDFLRLPLIVKRGAALLYQVTVDNRLALTVDVKNPRRGNAAFQTDLCVFDKVTEDILIPRVVMEFKTRITTHDVITYSAKAAKHKQVYPYLRYGIVASDISTVPGRLFTHNEALDFCAAVGGLSDQGFQEFFEKLLTSEVASSRRLEEIAYGAVRIRLFRTEIAIDPV